MSNLSCATSSGKSGAPFSGKVRRTCFTHLYINGRELGEAIRRHGADKVLFGTDSPWSDPVQQMEYIRSLELSEEDKRLVLGENARRLLKL